MIVTRNNGDVLFVLEGNEKDEFSILKAQELYDSYQYQWFEPLADGYRKLIYINNEDYVREAYRVFTWDDIVKFSLVDRWSLGYYDKNEGDWKQNPDGGAGYLLVLINNYPYWCDAVGQIPFAVDTYRLKKSIEATVQTGIDWALGTISGVLFGSGDYSNTYDNFFVLRGALFASSKFSYKTRLNERNYPSVVVEETQHDVDSDTLGNSITEAECEKYGIWKI